MARKVEENVEKYVWKKEEMLERKCKVKSGKESRGKCRKNVWKKVRDVKKSVEESEKR